MIASFIHDPFWRGFVCAAIGFIAAMLLSWLWRP